MMEIGYRYLCLWVCKLIGATRRIISQKLVVNLLSLLLITGALWAIDNKKQVVLKIQTPIFETYQKAKTRILDIINDLKHSEINKKTAPPDNPPAAPPKKANDAALLTLMNVLSIWALGLIIVWVIQARRRLVIGRFDDLTDGKAKINTQSFGIRLLHFNNELSELFSEFSLGHGSITGALEVKESLTPSIQTETLSQLVESAVTSESNLSLGPFKIPLGIILSLIGKMVRGPRIVGQIHLLDDRLIVTAELLGRQGTHLWKVEQVLTDNKPEYDLAYELACSIFSQLALENTVNSTSLKHYTAALRSYRTSISTKISHSLNLKHAEHELLQVVAQYPNFDLAYYNLGVVYTELGQLDAAGVSFDKSIQINNRRWSAFYALGRNHYTRGLNAEQNIRAVTNKEIIEQASVTHPHYLKAIDHCERASRLAPSLFIKAQALNLKALCYLRLGPVNRVDAALTARRAYKLAWWSLCIYESRRMKNTLAQKNLREQIYSFASLCLWNLSQYVIFDIENRKHRPRPVTAEGKIDLTAIAKINTKKSRQQRHILKKIIKYLQMARKLTPWVADIHKSLGLIFLQYGKHKQAMHVLYTCVRVKPSSSRPWGFLAYSYAHNYRENDVFNAFVRVLENIKTADNDCLDYCLKAFSVLYDKLMETQRFVTSIHEKKRKPIKKRDLIFMLFWFLPKFFLVALRMAGGSWTNLPIQSQTLQYLIQNKEQSQQYFAEKLTLLQIVADRVYKLETFNKDLAKLVAQEDIQTLEKRRAEEEKLGFHLECGMIEEGIGRCYAAQDKDTEAIEHIRLSIEAFNRSHPDEIQRRGLFSYLSHLQRRDNGNGAALNSALTGISKDPIGAYERKELGWAYFQIADFEEAQKAWQGALYWEPNDAGTHFNLGLSYYYQSQDTRNKALRKEQLNTAAEYFKNAYALDLQGNRRNDARYFMSKCYFDAARYTQALVEFRALEILGENHEVICLELADILISRGDYRQSEIKFRQVAAKLEDKLNNAKEGVNEKIDVPPDSQIHNIGIALCYAHIGIASTLIERDITLEEASNEITRAENFLDKLTNENDKTFWRSRCDLFKSQLDLKWGEPKKAIEKLEAAIAVDDDAFTYYLLATAIELIIKNSNDSDKLLLVKRFNHYCKQAQRNDWNDELNDRLEELRSRNFNL